MCSLEKALALIALNKKTIVKTVFDKSIVFLLLSIFLTNLSMPLAQSKTIAIVQNKASVTTTKVGDSCLTVYNQNRALIRQKRLFNLESGVNHLDWDNIPGTIDIHSVNLSAVNSNEPIKMREQNYQYDLLDTNSILTAALGKTVHLRRFMADGRTEEQTGILVSSPSSDKQIFKVGDRYILNQHGQIEIDEIPSSLISRPRLNFVVDASKAGQRDLALTYEASGINWQCDYIVVLNDTQDKFDISGLVTLDNTCGVSFANAKLKLIAGNVQSVRPVARAMTLYGASEAQMPNQIVQQASFADYHLYTFPEPVDINNRETKRLVLMERKAIPVVKKYIFDGQYFTYSPASQKTPVQVKLEFHADDKSKQPLPAGQVKVYQEDPEHELVLVGEDNISHTPAGEKVTIKLGDAFDVLGERKRISSEQSTDHRRVDVYKVAFHNYLEKDVLVTDIEHVQDLAIFSSDSTFTKLDSSTYQFDVKVPANGTAEVTYQTKSRI